MKQQINLYQEAFREKAVPCSARLILVVALVAMLILGSLHGYQRQGLKRADTQSELLAKEFADWEATTSALEKELNLSTAADHTAELLAQVTDELRGKRRVLGLYEKLNAAQSSGFGRFLEGLARQRVEGLWLTNIGIRAAGDQLRLEGSALTPTLVPEFIGKLSGEEAYAGHRFSAMKVQRPESETWRVDFVLSTMVDSSSLN